MAQRIIHYAIAINLIKDKDKFIIGNLLPDCDSDIKKIQTNGKSTLNTKDYSGKLEKNNIKKDNFILFKDCLFQFILYLY